MIPTDNQLDKFFSGFPDFKVIFSLPRLVDQGIVTKYNFPQFVICPERYLKKIEMSVGYDLDLIRKIGIVGLFRLARFDEIDPALRPNGYTVRGRGSGKIKFELVRHESYVRTEEITNIIEVKGCRNSGFVELLLFAIRYPRKQERFPIAALNAVFVGPRGERLVAVLGSKREDGAVKRVLSLVDESCIWYPDCRFLTEKA